MLVLSPEKETQDSYDVVLGFLHSNLADRAIYRRVMAFDFDDTIADNGNILPEAEPASEHCRNSGNGLYLVMEHRSYQGEELREALNQILPTQDEELRQLR